MIVITGGSDGIGAEMARQLAASGGAGVALVLAARNRAALEAVAGACSALGAQTLVVPTDVAVQQQCRDLIAQAVARFGRIDALINNAGRSAHALFEEVEDLGWYEELMRINLWGSVWCTHAALPHLKAARGSIVAVSSLAGPGRGAGAHRVWRHQVRDDGILRGAAGRAERRRRQRDDGVSRRGRDARSATMASMRPASSRATSALKEDDAMPVEECARLIIDGMNGRRREVVMTFKGKMGRFLKLVAPGLVEKLALAALKDDVKPH